jgi:hypothetical protein
VLNEDGSLGWRCLLELDRGNVSPVGHVEELQANVVGIPGVQVQAASSSMIPELLIPCSSSRFDPPLAAVFATYATQPLLALFHPPIELASCRPGSRLNLDRWIDFAAICLGTTL